MSAYWNMMSQMNGALVECGPLHMFQARRSHDGFGRFGATERNSAEIVAFFRLAPFYMARVDAKSASQEVRAMLW